MERQYTREVAAFPGAQALTINVRDNRSVRFLVDLPEEHPTPFQILLGPELLKNVDGMRSLGPCLFKRALFIPKVSLQPHRTTKAVRAAGRVRFGVSDVSVCVVEPVFPEK